MTHEARAIINALTEPAAAPYGARRAQVMRQAGFHTGSLSYTRTSGTSPRMRC